MGTMSQLWMGSLEPFMTETFIKMAFRKMGENPLNVKMMRNKLPGEAGYCFVEFASQEEAIFTMHKLNGKPIPDCRPVVRFRLNNAHNKTRTPYDHEFSVRVGDLSPSVDDFSLYKVFSSRYKTIQRAKVVLDRCGFSMGYGFVRFGSEKEMRDSLTSMKGNTVLGTNDIRICNATFKPNVTPFRNGTSAATSTTSTSATAGADSTQYYNPFTYFQNYANWQQPQGYSEQTGATQATPEEYQPVDAAAIAQNDEIIEDDLDLIDHTVPLDIDKLNKEIIDQDCNLWDALESSWWTPFDAAEMA